MISKLTPSYIKNALRTRRQRAAVNARIGGLIRQVREHTPHPAAAAQAVVFFNASTRINGVSQNAAFALLASLGLQLAGVPVVHFACKRGMSRCVMGAIATGPGSPPPCRVCIAQSRSLFANAPAVTFTYQPDASLSQALAPLSLDQLSSFSLSPDLLTYCPTDLLSHHPTAPLPLGPLCLPALRWVLRRHHLPDDEPTRALLREYILSAHGIACQFDALLEQVQPQAVVVFNGQFYPEAVARWVALRRGVRVITHEVGLRPFTAFFTPGEATAYPLAVPADFELTEAQNARLDEYLSRRFQGQFSMAGIRFWARMSRLDEAFLQRAASFRQIVPVFTNVIFDTSQPHSNVVFEHMFAWLDVVLDLARQHPDTLFVLRAHPDEARPGKESRESVAQWVAERRATDLPNVIFVAAQQPLSSYELIQRSKFVMIYNSTIGLEASILGAAVLCAGKARFTQLPTVFFPSTVEAFCRQAEDFLSAERVAPLSEFQRNARRFLYYQLFCSSLPFGDFIEEDGLWPGFVRLKQFPWRALTLEQSPAMRAILDGLLHGGNFLLPDDR
jgi:hypothetical protein